MIYAFVKKGDAQKVKSLLSAAGLLAKGAPVLRREYKGEDEVGFPITNNAGEPLTLDLGGFSIRLEDVDLPTPPLNEKKSWKTDDGFPRSFDLVGDIAIVRLKPDYDLEKAKKRAEELMKANPPVKAVFARAGPLTGQYRVSPLIHLAGENRTITLYKENGSSFFVDVASTFFSPRLSGERARISSMVQPGERVLDMFAGVGPFSVQMARAGATVFACEINPAAFNLLNTNVALNGLVGRIRTFPGDAALVSNGQARGWAKRIVMNLPSSSTNFLEAALNAISPTGGVIHIYVRSTQDPGEEILKSSPRLSLLRVGTLKEVSTKEKIFSIDLMVKGSVTRCQKAFTRLRESFMFLDPLKRDHEETLRRMAEFEEALSALRRGNFLGAQRMVNYIAEEVVDKHFKAEEEGFFPVFEPVLKRYLPKEEPLRMLKLEHLAAAKAVEEMRSCMARADVEKAAESGEYLVDLLKQHIFREENGVFAMADKYMTDDEKRVVEEKLRSLSRGNP
ncbi:MAG: hemerythrin domain-containing protein [Candidatus Marsarchaeota archaeon]